MSDCTAEGGRKDRTRRDFDILLKPGGAACNLRCRYCYYLEKSRLFSGESRMTDDLLEKIVREYIGAYEGPRIPFTFHGGEPTLLGIPYYEKILKLQRRYGDGRPIDNAIQTNGTMLDDGWGAFLASNGFLVGLSLDGPQALHDVFRRTAAGAPTFESVRRGLDVLLRHGVEFNTLGCVDAVTYAHAVEIYRFLVGAGVRCMQFIPIVERVGRAGFSAAPPSGPTPGLSVTEWSVTPDGYGQFLCDLFDEWARADIGRVHVQLFETTLAHWVGVPGGLCFFRPECGCAPVVERNGDVYACDHYVYPEYRIGSLKDSGLAELVRSSGLTLFGERKRTSLTRECRECPYLFACNGECPKHRFAVSKDGEYGANYLCPAYRRYFRHATPTMNALAKTLSA